jgi:hypothetical protein
MPGQHRVLQYPQHLKHISPSHPHSEQCHRLRSAIMTVATDGQKQAIAGLFQFLILVFNA